MILSHISRRKHGKTHHFSPPMKMFRSRVGAGSRGLPAPQRRLALCAWLCGWSQGLKWAVFTRKNGYGSVWVMRIDWNNCLMMLSKVGFIWFYMVLCWSQESVIKLALQEAKHLEDGSKGDVQLVSPVVGSWVFAMSAAVFSWQHALLFDLWQCHNHHK